jgi:peroxin-2
MPAADFAAAQARIAARRQQRLTDQRRSNVRLQRSIPAPGDNGSSVQPTLRPSRLSPFHSLADASMAAWESIRGREGTKPAFRVGQVDAELLDEELLELLKGQVGEGLKYYGVRIP